MRIYRWYDQVKEPWRFGLMLLFTITTLTMMNYSDTLGIKFLGAFAMLFVLGTRIYYLHFSKNKNTP